MGPRARALPSGGPYRACFLRYYAFMQNAKPAVRLSRMLGFAALASMLCACASAPPQDRSAPGRNAGDEASRSRTQKAVAAFDSGYLESALAQVDAALGLNGNRGDALRLR